MQALPNGHKVSDLPPTFPCAQCEQTILDHKYAVRSSDNEMICYTCAWTLDMSTAAQMGELFAYVHGVEYKRHRFAGLRNMPTYQTVQTPDAAIIMWPGQPFSVGPLETLEPYRDNFGGIRIPLRCQLPTGPQGALENWYGTFYASAGDYCRLRRNKHQPQRNTRPNTTTATTEAA